MLEDSYESSTISRISFSRRHHATCRNPAGCATRAQQVVQHIARKIFGTRRESASSISCAKIKSRLVLMVSFACCDLKYQKPCAIPSPSPMRLVTPCHPCSDWRSFPSPSLIYFSPCEICVDMTGIGSSLLLGRRLAWYQA